MTGIFVTPSDRPAQCFQDKQNSIFVQYTCEQSEEQLRVKFNSLCLAAALGILSCCLFLIAVRKVSLGNSITMAEWDLHNVTVTDYAVELPIN